MWWESVQVKTVHPNAGVPEDVRKIVERIEGLGYFWRRHSPPAARRRTGAAGGGAVGGGV
jgi:hypothetical protein